MAKKEPETVEVTLPAGMTAEKLRNLLEKAQQPKSALDPAFVIFKELPRGDKNKLRVYRDTYKEKEFLSIRNWYQDDEDGSWRPGKGVTFSFDEIPEIIEGLEEMLNWCDEHPNGTKREGQDE